MFRIPASNLIKAKEKNSAIPLDVFRRVLSVKNLLNHNLTDFAA